MAAKKNETKGSKPKAAAKPAVKQQKAKQEKPAKQERVKQNNETRPAAGTKTGRVWEIADALSKKQKAPAPRADVIAEFVKEGGNPATGATQYGRWCRFHGITKETAKGKPQSKGD